MEEYADIYYMEDARNATRDHRAQASRAPWRPGRAVQSAPYRPAYSQPAYSPPAYQEAAYPQPPFAPPAYAPPAFAAPQFAAPMYPPGWYGQTAGSVLGRMTLGQIAEVAAQVVASLMSLPPTPAPAVDGNPSVDIRNLVTYQEDLAKHAKRDEQLRTLGSLVARLVA